MKEQVLAEFKEWIKEKEAVDVTSFQKNAAAYIRVSSGRQEEFSPISQLKKIWEYCISNKIYLDLNYVFIEDEGISAKGSKIDKRIEFNKMISIAKTKKNCFDIIIVWKFSRFCRNQEQSIVYKSLLRKECNIDVKSITEPIIEGPFGDLIERIIEWADEYYLINLSQEVKRGMTEAAHTGKYQSVAPFGYRWENGKLIIKEDEANIVKMIYDKFISDEMTMMDLARYINNLGFKTKRGGNFENRTINYILLNPVYKGYSRWTPDGKLTREEMYNNTRSIIEKGTHEPIIDEDTWNLATKKLEKFRSFRKPHQIDTNKPWDWIKGLIRCTCGKTFIRTSGKLRCNGYNKGACLIHDTIDIEEVKQLILAQIKEYYNDPTNIIITNNVKKKKNSEKEVLITQLNMLSKKEERIKNAYINGIDTIDEYKENKIKLKREISLIENKLNSIKKEKDMQEKTTIVENLHKCYDILTDDKIEMKRKYDVAHELIDKIIYENGELSLYFNTTS